MKINVQNDYGLYRKKIGEAAVGKTATNTVTSAFKLDTNAISRGNTKISDKQMLGVKSDINNYLSAPTDVKRLVELREKIQGGSYKVDSDEIAKSILGNR